MIEKMLLKGDSAKQKWKQGRDVWNKWVDDNPEANVSFAGVTFEDDDKTDYIIGVILNRGFNFVGYKFPKGIVCFKDAEFSDGNVEFFGTEFGDGDVSFSNTRFGQGTVSFANTRFGQGTVSFVNTRFGSGTVNFGNTRFGTGTVSFDSAKFGDGNVFFCGIFGHGFVTFEQAEFGEGNVSFVGTNFGEGDLSFYGVKFGKGDVIYNTVAFGKGDVSYDNVIFGEGNVSFNHSTFGVGDVSFANANFGIGDLSFHQTTFEGKIIDFSLLKVVGDANFNDIFVSQNCEQFCFNKATFDGPFSLSYNLVNNEPENSPRQYAKINFIPNLIGTKTSHHVNLHNLYCKPKFTEKFLLNMAEDINDSERLGRLKELAESNKDHESALRFHADEMRVKRWVKRPRMASFLDLIFDKTSNYGQSILMPSLLLLSMFSLIFIVSLFGSPCHYKVLNLNNAFNLSLSKTIPFVSGLAIEGKDAAGYLSLSGYIKSFINVLSIFSYIFLFLIGLGLRNRFRI